MKIEYITEDNMIYLTNFAKINFDKS